MNALLMTLLTVLLMAAPASTAAQAPLKAGEKGVPIPQLLRAPRPVYPNIAIRERAGAEVVLAFVVDATGKVAHPEVLDFSIFEDSKNARTSKSDDRLKKSFIDASLTALMRRRYAPAIYRSEPVSVAMEVAIDFVFEEEASRRRWSQVEEGLSVLAEDLIPEGAAVAGQDGVSYPITWKNPNPIQPTGAMLRGIQSRVTLLVLVSEQGDVAQIVFTRAENNDYGFAKAAETAVGRWRFRPAYRDDKPIAAYHWVRLRIPPSTSTP